MRLDVSSTQVSRATTLLDEELSRWRNRPLGEVPYVFLDARYEKIRHGGSVVSCAVLMAFGVDESGHRTVLGVSVSLSEAEVHWRDFFAGLQERGLSGVRLLISDDHAGLKAAREARFPGVPWQRCQFHLQQNAGHYVPRIEMRREVAGDLRAIFESGDGSKPSAACSQAVEKYAQRAPKLSAWMEANVAESFTVFCFPETHRRRSAHIESHGENQQRIEAAHASARPCSQTRPRCFASLVLS